MELLGVNERALVLAHGPSVKVAKSQGCRPSHLIIHGSLSIPIHFIPTHHDIHRARLEK
jgi:hypothetical protein